MSNECVVTAVREWQLPDVLSSRPAMNTSFPNSSITLARASLRTVGFLLIVAAHIVFGLACFRNTMELQTVSAANLPMYGEWIEQDPPADSVFVESHDIPPDPLSIPVPELPEVSVAVLNDEPALEEPKIDPLSGPDVAAYSQRANLPAGKTATILLTVGIGVDGAVVSARVVRSSGDAAVNAAALDYARATRWIPATVDGQPRAMEASLTVILGESA
jgi:TonB family protein